MPCKRCGAASAEASDNLCGGCRQDLITADETLKELIP